MNRFSFLFLLIRNSPKIFAHKYHTNIKYNLFTNVYENTYNKSNYSIIDNNRKLIRYNNRKILKK